MIKTAIRAGMVAGFGFALVAADEPATTAPAPDYPEPPAIVAERIVDGRFEPGNFEYLRGYFSDASPDQKAEYAELAEWLKQCGEEGRERLDAGLAALGVKLEFDNYTSAVAPLCGQVFAGERFQDRFANYEELEAATIEARLVFATLVEAVRISEERVGPLASDFARQLEVRPLGDQLLRSAFAWTRVPNDNPRLPHMSQDASAVFNVLLLGEMRRVDHENTVWLKEHVQKDGWPVISEVGEKAADMAWLLVQHADADPAFQLEALRLMEPLVAENEASKSNFAYLYDRIMLKLNGKQRYGTQVTCIGGKYGPRPLEEPDRINELRAEMELNSIEIYLGWFRGTCKS